MRILVAEDDANLADSLKHSLHNAGYAVDCVQTGLEADSAVASSEFDLLILDLGLPKMSGLEVLRRLRARRSSLPVLILTALDSVNDRVHGLDLGADDYLVKPFVLAELEARVRALVRRGSSGSPLLHFGALCFDTVGQVARIDDEVVELSARELALLRILLQRPGCMVSKEHLVNHVCEWGEEISVNAIEVYIHRLRKKLHRGGVKIATVRGLGYCLERPQTH